MLASDLCQRILSEERVVTVVTVSSGAFRIILQLCLIEFLKQCILVRHAIGHRRHLAKRARTQSQKKGHMSHHPSVASAH
jgi:hypothetical protein